MGSKMTGEQAENMGRRAVASQAYYYRDMALNGRLSDAVAAWDLREACVAEVASVAAIMVIFDRHEDMEGVTAFNRLMMGRAYAQLAKLLCK